MHPTPRAEARQTGRRHAILRAAMKTYMLVVRDRPEDFAGIDAAAMDAIVARYRAWGERLAASGKLVGGEKLVDGRGRVVRGNNGRLTVHDGAYAESREVIGGYWLLRAEDDEDALRLVSDHPHLETRGSLELREVEQLGGPPPASNS